MLDFLDSKGVGLAVLTDVKFPVQGLRKFQSEAQEWMVLITGPVAFAMTSRLR